MYWIHIFYPKLIAATGCNNNKTHIQNTTLVEERTCIQLPTSYMHLYWSSCNINVCSFVRDRIVFACIRYGMEWNGKGRGHTKQPFAHTNRIYTSSIYEQFTQAAAAVALPLRSRFSFWDLNTYIFFVFRILSAVLFVLVQILYSMRYTCSL